jgi:hypothetical protein
MKRRYLPSKLQDVMSQEIATFIVTTVRIYNFTFHLSCFERKSTKEMRQKRNVPSTTLSTNHVLLLLPPNRHLQVNIRQRIIPLDHPSIKS